MKIDRKLNIVLPFEKGWVHATPISYAIFEKYFLPISKTFARVYGEGLSQLAGPRVAGLLLKSIAIQDGYWDTPDGVEKGLMNEIIRLSNVIILGDGKAQPAGWNTMPLYDALALKLIDEEEKSEIVNGLVFFTCASCMHRKAEIEAILRSSVRFWAGHVTSLNSTEYAHSLPTSTPEESTGEKVTPS